MTMHRVDFEGEDILQNRNYFDLLEDGSFTGDFVVIDFDVEEEMYDPPTWYHATVFGTWWRLEEEEEVKESLARLDLMLDIDQLVRWIEMDFGKALKFADFSPGEIIDKAPWENWEVEEITKEEYERAANL